MNKELREDLEHLIICNDKTITQDLRDDIKMTLDYIDKLEEENKNDYFIHMKEWARAIGNNANLRQRIDKAIEQLEEILEMAKDYGEVNLVDRLEIILKILRGKDESVDIKS